MRSIIITAFKGLLLTAIFYLLVCFVINRIYLSDKRAACWISPQFQRLGGQEYRIMKDWKGSSQYDVLVIGSSHAYRGYDPRIFDRNNLRMFTAGSGFQNPLAGYILLKDIFYPQQGSVVIIDIFDQTFEGDGTGSYTRLIQNVTSRKAAFELAWRQPDMRTFNSFMCRSMSNLDRVEVPDEDGYLMNGYCPKSDTMKVEPTEFDKQSDFNPRFRSYVQKTIDLVIASGATPVLVAHPQPKSKTNKKFHEEFLNFFNPVTLNGNVLFLDYNTEHSLNNHEHFADANHLNQAGVNLFNAMLIADLKKNGILN